MGCSSSKSDTAKPAAAATATAAPALAPASSAPAPAPAPSSAPAPAPPKKAASPQKVQDNGNKKDPDFKQIHSAVRWNKDFEEIKDLLNSEEAVNIADKGNGNTPIHIASQNGMMKEFRQSFRFLLLNRLVAYFSRSPEHR
jgi:hypothetical protein